MKQYLVRWKYKSSLGGPWRAGEVVALDDERAADIGRDSPGVLALHEPEALIVAAPASEEILQEEPEAQPEEAAAEEALPPEEISQAEEAVADASDLELDPEAPEARIVDTPPLDRMARPKRKRGS
jgi:hypothetical protein